MASPGPDPRLAGLTVRHRASAWSCETHHRRSWLAVLTELSMRCRREGARQTDSHPGARQGGGGGWSARRIAPGCHRLSTESHTRGRPPQSGRVPSCIRGRLRDPDCIRVICIERLFIAAVVALALGARGTRGRLARVRARPVGHQSWGRSVTEEHSWQRVIRLELSRPINTLCHVAPIRRANYELLSRLWI